MPFYSWHNIRSFTFKFIIGHVPFVFVFSLISLSCSIPSWCFYHCHFISHSILSLIPLWPAFTRHVVPILCNLHSLCMSVFHQYWLYTLCLQVYNFNAFVLINKTSNCIYFSFRFCAVYCMPTLFDGWNALCKNKLISSFESQKAFNTVQRCSR